MAVPSDVFKEHVTVMEGLKASYGGTEDASMVSTVECMEGELRNIFAERTSAMHDVVRSLTRRVEEAEVDATPADVEVAHDQKMEHLQQRLSQTKENVEKLSRERRFLQQQRKKLEMESDSLETRKRELRSFIKKTDPRTRSVVSLHVHITNIYWDDCSAGAQWKGIHSRKGDIVTVDVDPLGLSNFEAVNKVWDIISR